MHKLKSRKFWLTVASLLGSIGTTIAGLSTDDKTLATVGIICAVVSSGIYSMCEAFVDATKK